MFLGSKNQGGRPVKPTDERRSYSVTVKFTMEEMTALRQAVKKSGMPRAALIRELVRKGKVSPRITPEELALMKDLQHDLRKIGTNINTIARKLNAGIGQVTPGQVNESLARLRDLAVRYQNKLL